MVLYIERLIKNKGYTIVLIEFTYFRFLVLFCILKDRSNTSPIRKVSSNLSYFIIWNRIMKIRSNISPILPSSSNLSYFRNIV